MRLAAVVGGLLLLVAAGVLLYQINSTRDALQNPTAAASDPAAVPVPGAAPGPGIVPVPVPAPVPGGVAAPILAPSPVGAPAHTGGAPLPSTPVGARPPTGGTRFADPSFNIDPQLSQGITEQEATRVAEGGITAVERRNALEWLMAHGSADSYAVVQRVRASDPDPQVRTMAEAGVHMMQSRFPQFMGQ
jgi:hypothetical protein